MFSKSAFVFALALAFGIGNSQGQKVPADLQASDIEILRKAVRHQNEKMTFMLHKPRSFISQTSDKLRPSQRLAVQLLEMHNQDRTARHQYRGKTPPRLATVGLSLCSMVARSLVQTGGGCHLAYSSRRALLDLMPRQVHEKARLCWAPGRRLIWTVVVHSRRPPGEPSHWRKQSRSQRVRFSMRLIASACRTALCLTSFALACADTSSSSVIAFRAKNSALVLPAVFVTVSSSTVCC